VVSAPLSVESTHNLIGRWKSDDVVIVFDSDGRLYLHSRERHSRQRYQWNAETGSLLVSASQAYYPEQEASQMIKAFGGNSPFQAALDRSYCVEVEPLTELSAQKLSLSFEGEDLLLSLPAKTALQDMMQNALALQGLHRNRFLINGELRLSPAPF